jgi:hypothetical protein
MQTCVHAFDGKVLVLDGLHDIHGKDWSRLTRDAILEYRRVQKMVMYTLKVIIFFVFCNIASDFLEEFHIAIQSSYLLIPLYQTACVAFFIDWCIGMSGNCLADDKAFQMVRNGLMVLFCTA